MPYVQGLQAQREVSSVIPVPVPETRFCHLRCPHVTDVCRNRQLHPRGDVVYMKNAEGVC